MDYDIVFENERDFNIVYDDFRLSLIIYYNGEYYHYRSGKEKTIEDVEKLEKVSFNLTKEEREEINNILACFRFLKEQNEREEKKENEL